MAINVYYFGCQSGEMGHYFYDGNRSAHMNVRASVPWSRDLDGGLCPGDPKQTPFRALVHQKYNWTAIAFWDRTGDSRLGSNSAFLFDERVDFAQGIALAKSKYPWLFERFGQEIVEWVDEG